MSIKNILPLYTDPKAQDLTGAGGRPRSPEAASFAATLQEAGGDGKAVAAAVQICRLEMMRGAISVFDLQPEEGALPLPSTFPLWSAYGAPGRKIDISPADSPASSAKGPDGIDDIVDRASRRYAVEPALIKAVIKAESAFDPQAVSPAGAEGLMQLMPATARGLGVENSFDAEQNVMAGTRYLKSLLDRYDGDLDTALAGYNWGPGNVARKGTGSLPEETRSYQARVRRYYDGYLA